MSPLLFAVLLASVAGSTHCAGMCGAFLAFAVTGEPSAPPRSRVALHAAYNLGRLCTYSLMGAAAGLIGSAIDLGGSAVGVQRAALVFAGCLMIIFGVVAVLRVAGIRISRAPLPLVLVRAVTAAHRAVGDWPPVARAGAVGLLTTLLPCGWLYAFGVTAAGTADWKLGMLVMGAFWLGTLPVMLALGAGLQAFLGPLRRRAPLLTAVAMLSFGTWTVLGRVSLPSFANSGSGHALTSVARPAVPQKAPCCHED